MPTDLAKVALLYDNDGYVELLQRRENAPPEAARGLMGRQVAGKEFLDAYLRFGRWDQLVTLVRNESSRKSIINYFRDHPFAHAPHTLRVIAINKFCAAFHPADPAAAPAATTLHFPCPIDAHFAWSRHHAGPGAYALTGLTHTICTPAVMRSVCELVEAPFESFDSLICISRAALQSVKSVADSYAAYLKDRFGGNPHLRPRLAHIPLGVNPERYRPATPAERLASRQTLNIPADAIVVLFVGRLSYAGKVHPFPMFQGLNAAALATGKPVHLILSGWAENDILLQHFKQGAATFASNITTTIVNGTNPAFRYSVWHAADIFTSLTDNIQETLSQVILEGMACGLPVVITDWDGCRDQAIDGQHGYLVPARMVHNATQNLAPRHLINELPYGQFLADCNQTVSVDLQATTAAFTRLINDPALRRQMGAAARQRILENFTWERTIHAYQALWTEQNAVRKSWLAQYAHAAAAPRPYFTPAVFPEVEQAYASYPMTILDAPNIVQTDRRDLLDALLATPITNYRAEARVADRALLLSILAAAAAGCSIANLDALLAAAKVPPIPARATIAWMLKYSLLKPA